LVLIDVLKKGVYIGGGILSGIDMSINALYGNTAKLPRVKFTTPSSVLGTDTMKQIQAAIFFGYAGQIKHIIKASTAAQLTRNLPKLKFDFACVFTNFTP